MGLSITSKITNVLKSIVLLPYLIVYLLSCYLVSLKDLICKKRKNLNGEVVLITGCGSGIGYQVALSLATLYEDRITLVLWDYNEEGLKEIQLKLRSLSPPPKTFSYVVDVSNPELVSSTARKVQSDAGDVTLLINNAGISFNRGFLSLTPNEIRKTIRINFLAHFWTIKAFLPAMIENNKGHIVATCSMGGQAGLRGNVPYYTTKFALKSSMMALEEEVQHCYPDQTNVRFTTVYPWFVETPLIHNLDVRFRFPKLTPRIQPQEVAKSIVNALHVMQKEVFVPHGFIFYFWLLRVLPESVRRKILEFSIVEYKGAA